jgi:DNA invertase Pin-like site-specific DNA recombinase
MRNEGGTNMTTQSAHLAVCYFRTSSQAGVDGDSEARQRAAVTAYAKSAKLTIVAEFYDAAVSGADPLADRPGFTELMASLRSTGANKIIVETANRFARDLLVQETGWRWLQRRGVELIAADSPGAFVDETPTSVLIRQVLGAVSQFDKSMLVAKLRAARLRTGRMGGRRPIGATTPEATARAKQLTGSLRQIARQLAIEGMVSSTGRPFSAKTVAEMRRQ